MSTAAMKDLFSDYDETINVQPKAKSQQEAWKEDLYTELVKFNDISERFNSVIGEAQAYTNAHLTSLSLFSEFKTILNKWLTNVCNVADSESNNYTASKITINSLSDTLKDFYFPRKDSLIDPSPTLKSNKTFRSANGDELAQWVIENFDFDRLLSEINQAKKDILSIGLAKSADELLLSFGMLRGRGGRNDVYEIKQQKGRYLLDMSYYGSYRFDRLNRISELLPHVNTFESESDASGLSSCLQCIIDAENALPSSLDDYVKSRTKVSAIGNVSATFFNNKIKFSFQPDIFEALYSFIFEYRSDRYELTDIKIV